MKLTTSINKKNLNELVIKSSIWNSIIEVFKYEKNMDITPYLVSIQIKGNRIIIKTSKTILNTELLMLSDKINYKISEKLKKIGLRFEEFEIRYI
nr:hypothetical protein [Candidatus Gracilibacteria bacterium]